MGWGKSLVCAPVFRGRLPPDQQGTEYEGDPRIERARLHVLEVYDEADRDRLEQSLSALFEEEPAHQVTDTPSLGQGILTRSLDPDSPTDSERILCKTTSWISADAELLARFGRADYLPDPADSRDRDRPSSDELQEVPVDAIRRVEAKILDVPGLPFVVVVLAVRLDPEAIPGLASADEQIPQFARPFQVWLEATGGLTTGPIVSPRVPLLAVVDVSYDTDELQSLSRLADESLDEFQDVSAERLPFVPTKARIGHETHIPTGAQYGFLSTLRQPALGGWRSLLGVRANGPVLQGEEDRDLEFDQLPTDVFERFHPHLPPLPSSMLTHLDVGGFLWILVLDVWLEHLGEEIERTGERLSRFISESRGDDGHEGAQTGDARSGFETATEDRAEALHRIAEIGSRISNQKIQLGRLRRLFKRGLERYAPGGSAHGREIGVVRAESEWALTVSEDDFPGLVTYLIESVRERLDEAEAVADDILQEVETASRFQAIRSQERYQRTQAILSLVIVAFAVLQIAVTSTIGQPPLTRWTTIFTLPAVAIYLTFWLLPDW